jgi:hypothetical protein
MSDATERRQGPGRRGTDRFRYELDKARLEGRRYPDETPAPAGPDPQDIAGEAWDAVAPFLVPGRHTKAYDCLRQKFPAPALAPDEQVMVRVAPHDPAPPEAARRLVCKKCGPLFMPRLTKDKKAHWDQDEHEWCGPVVEQTGEIE